MNNHQDDPGQPKASQPEHNPAALADLYDDAADEYVRVFFNDLTDAPWLDLFISSLAKGHAVLDVGCGPGNFASYLTKHKLRVTGIDISPKMIDAARRLVPSGQFEVMDCVSLAFAEGTFDGILIAYSLLHLPKPEALRCLREVGRVLKPGGVLAMMLKEGTGNFDMPASLVEGKTCYVKLWETSEVLGELAGLGFRVFHQENGDPTASKELQFRKLFFLASNKPSLETPLA